MTYAVTWRSHELALPSEISVVVVLLTPRSIGKPKVVPLTHKNVLTSTRDMARAQDLSEPDRCLVQWSQRHIGIHELIQRDDGDHRIAVASFLAGAVCVYVGILLNRPTN